MTLPLHHELRRHAVKTAIRLALRIGRHDLPVESEDALSSELAAMALAETTSEAMIAHCALILQLELAGLSLPAEQIH